MMRLSLVKTAFCVCSVFLFFGTSVPSQADSDKPLPAYDQVPVASPLPRATPESEGISSEAIEAAILELDDKIDTMNSLMILRHGKVIAECWWAPHTPETPHNLYSVTKSFMATAVGFAVQEGKLALSDPVIKFFPDDLPAAPDGTPAVSENLGKMTVRDLLTMSCGQETTVSYDFGSEESPEKQFLKHPVVFEPGTHFLYNTSGCYILSAILQKAVGETAEEYLRSRLFEPLEIAAPYWLMEPNGVTEGGYGLMVRTEELAKFGLFCMQKGEWNGQQLLNSEWFDEASRKQVSNGDYPESDWGQGYGYLFWRCRHNAYRADGMLGQYCVMIPDKDMMIVSTADVNVDQPILDLYWDKILSQVQDEPIPENKEAYQHLLKTASGLKAKPGCSESEERVGLSFHSNILGRDVSYSVYLPKNYRTNGGTWKILYLLHGLNGNHTSWFNPKSCKLKEITDPIFTEYPDQKRIIVSPDAARTWYVNEPDGEQYEDFFVQELIPEVEKMFRVRPGRENRGIAGLSMGGYGALHLAIRHPDLFSRCYAISAAVRTDSQIRDMDYKAYHERFGNVYGVSQESDGRFTENYRKYDVLSLINQIPESQKDAVMFTLDCGDDDHLLEGNCEAYARMKKRGIPAEFRVRDGKHDSIYFRSALPFVYKFMAEEPKEEPKEKK